jgi:hypothetical protein
MVQASWQPWLAARAAGPAIEAQRALRPEVREPTQDRSGEPA